MKKPNISIITPSFNSAKFLEQTIESVLSQGYPALEYIIIDGGSSDGTVDIIKKYEKHIAYWISEPDKGQSHAINKGLHRATGEIVNWLNADDFYEMDSLKKVATYFKDPSINCFCGKSNIVNERGKFIRKSSGTDLYGQNLAKTIGMARVDQPETFFLRSVFKKLGGLNEQLHYVMDKEFWMRYLLVYGLQGISKGDDTLVNFRLHGQSKTGSGTLKFQQETDALLFSMAIRAGLSTEADFIKDVQKLQSIQCPKIDWPEVDKDIIEKVLQYYYLYLADHFYYTEKVKECALLLNVIQEKRLETEDIHLLKKLKFRNKFLPKFVQKLKQSLL